jgi:hypothetical protein
MANEIPAAFNFSVINAMIFSFVRVPEIGFTKNKRLRSI